jgi:hypothetical protein
MPKTKKEQLAMTSPELLEQLRTAWTTTQPTAKPATVGDAKRGTIDAAGTVANMESVRAGGIAVERCTYHIPPFDAIEYEDQRRPGFIRSDCRLCGCFLGYCPKGNPIDLECRG